MRRLLPFVCLVVVVDTMLYAALTPLLPHFQRSFDLSKGGVGLLAAAYGIGTFAGAIPGGVVAARFGARTAVLAGLIGVAVTSVGVALAGDFGTLFTARLLQGVASSQTWAGALAWLALATPRERRGRTMGIAMGAAVGGAVLGPVVGAAGSLVGVRAAFATVAGVCAVLAFVGFAFEPSPREVQPARAVFGALRSAEFLRGLWLISLPALLFGTLNVLAPLALDRRGFSAAAIGAVWIGATAIESVVNPWLGRVTDRLGPAAPTRFALAGSTLAAVALAATERPWVLVPLILVTSVAFGGFYAPGLTMLSHAAESVGLAQGLSFGLMNAAWAIGNAVGPAAGGGLAEVTTDAVPYLAAAGICAASFAFLARLEHRRAAAAEV
ncbi:MAG TPA: MFS transporter [Gaiellaceae bacterium]|nr:MFS transporter [Gaiellaceae bacterium]